MTMDSQLKDQVVFHLTGRRAKSPPATQPNGHLRPALMATFRDLQALRYDFPVVLVDRPQAGQPYVESLTAIVDGLLRKTAPQGVGGEGMRRRTFRVEREIRRLAASGFQGPLSTAWDQAVAAADPAADEAARREVAKVRHALTLDGAVAHCDAALPRRFVRHAWAVVQQGKARAARERIHRLIVRLDEILRADEARSAAALRAPALQASIGAAHHSHFDFDAMSRLLSRVEPRGGLSSRRRERVERALATLRAQRFFDVGDKSAASLHAFEFDNVDAALAAFRERLPELVELLRAMEVAELEIAGRYVEDTHDAIVAGIDATSIGARDLEAFPDYLVCLDAASAGHAGAHLGGPLSSGVPLKILVQVNDLLEEAAIGAGSFAFGPRSAQLATMAMSFGEVFVLQSAASNLLQLRDRVLRGMQYPGAALFSVFAAADGDAGSLPGYLEAAAAMQSRAFPAFSYDPSAGPDLASRFSLENNPQPEQDWSVETLSYADEDLQSVTEQTSFGFVDFVASDPRYASHFAAVARSAWSDAMIPAADWLARPPADAAGHVPYVLVVDDTDLLWRVVVDEKLMRAAQRCREAWHRLQEYGRVHERRREAELLAAAQAAQALAAAKELPTSTEPAAKSAASASAPATDTAQPLEAQPDPDVARIETFRCSSCNECTQVNPRMFAYNENKQAYIADLKAGTYRQLVEAAESCQLSIIHPGKPWNPSEPGLEDLVERAKLFI
jgi:ferredoxin